MWAGIATRYGLDGPGINSGGDEIFGTCPDRSRGPPSLLYNGYRVYFPGVKQPGRRVHHPPPSSAKVKERLELYLYSPFCLHGCMYGEVYLSRDTVVTKTKVSALAGIRTSAVQSVAGHITDSL